jgi:hypothetical protein
LEQLGAFGVYVPGIFRDFGLFRRVDQGRPRLGCTGS